MRIQGYKQAHTNLRIWGCRDASDGTRTWGYEDVRMRGYKQTSTHEYKDIKMGGCEDINKSNISKMYVTSRSHVGY